VASIGLPGWPAWLSLQLDRVLYCCKQHRGHSYTGSRSAGWMGVRSQRGHYQRDLQRSSGPTLQLVGVLLLMGTAF
jgi:hypothetical protein